MENKDQGPVTFEDVEKLFRNQTDDHPQPAKPIMFWGDEPLYTYQEIHDRFKDKTRSRYDLEKEEYVVERKGLFGWRPVFEAIFASSPKQARDHYRLYLKKKELWKKAFAMDRGFRLRLWGDALIHLFKPVRPSVGNEEDYQ